MSSLLLSRITKDFLNADPDVVASQARYRMGWAGSVLAVHPKAKGADPRGKGAQLLELKRKLASLFKEEKKELPPLSHAPKLSPPLPVIYRSHYQPFRYFSKGEAENDQKKNPSPIPYLLTETNETAQARPVPGNSLLLRSLCKGKGVLKQNKQGFVFLDIDNRFIFSLLPYLKTHGLISPPYFTLFASPEGAHIPVIPVREVKFHYLDQIEELGREFSFEIEGLYSAEATSWPEVEQVWFFTLKSAELETLRRKYLLPATPGGHPFHIAIAIKPRVLPHPSSPPMLRINVSFLAA